MNSASTVSKAIAGGLVTLVVSYLAKYGVTLNPDVANAGNVIITAVVTYVVGFVSVYLAPPNSTK